MELVCQEAHEAWRVAQDSRFSLQEELLTLNHNIKHYA